MPENNAARPPRTRKRTRRLALYLIATLLVLAAAWAVFAPEAAPVEVARVTEGPMQVTVNNEGRVRARDRYLVAAPTAGALQRIELRQGERVRQGQPVAILEPLPLDARQRQQTVAQLEAARAVAREASARMQRAQSELELARSELARSRDLAANGFLSDQAVQQTATRENAARAEMAAAQLRQRAAEADVKAAEAALSAADLPPGQERRIALAAPVDGYVVAVHEQSARTVAAGTALLTIGDPSCYEIVADVLSTDAVRIPAGAPMLLESWGGGKTLQARVRLVEPVAFTEISALGVEEQRVNVVADPVDALGPLGDGYRVEARIVVWSGERVLKLPGSSLFRVGDAWHVFTVEDGRAREREVRVGQRNQEEAQILSGLDAGSVVVRFPSNTLRDGMRVVARDMNR